MTQGLLIGVAALVAAVGLLVIALPNKSGESPHFLQSSATQMAYPAVVLVFFALGVAELVAWAATLKW